MSDFILITSTSPNPTLTVDGHSGWQHYLDLLGFIYLENKF